MAGCGPIKTRKDLEAWFIGTLDVAWHHQCTVAMDTKFSASPPDGPGLGGPSIMTLGFTIASGFNLLCQTQLHPTDFFGCVKVGDMVDIVANKLGF